MVDPRQGPLTNVADAVAELPVAHEEHDTTVMVLVPVAASVVVLVEPSQECAS